jgi:hypothetical protein
MWTVIIMAYALAGQPNAGSVAHVTVYTIGNSTHGECVKLAAKIDEISHDKFKTVTTCIGMDEIFVDGVDKGSN